MNKNMLWDILSNHFGHRVEIIKYENPVVGVPADICLEDIDTNEVILDAECYTLAARHCIDYEQKYLNLIKSLRKIGVFVKDDNDDLGDIVSIKVWTREDIGMCLRNENFLNSEENIDLVANHIGEGLADCTDRDWDIIYNAINDCSDKMEVMDKSVL